MASELSREELRRLASIGAARRLEELRQEQAAILAAFPELGRARAGQPERSAKRGARPRTAGAEAAASRKAKRSYKMSAAQKRAVSERMKKYWAARRKAEG